MPTSPRRTPQLALPFALLGAMIGYASTRFFTSPIVGIASPELGIATPMVLAAASSAIIGVVVTRAARDAEDDGEAPAFGRRVLLALAGAGALVGGIVGELYGTVGSGVAWGIASGALAFPLAASIVRAGVRARRARHGSIVAAADARIVWGSMAAAVAVATVPAWVAWPLMVGEGAPEPFLAVAGCAAALVVVGIEIVAGARARARLADVAAQLSPAAGGAGDDLPTTDLGLGSDRSARVDGAFTSYRAAERATELVVGDVEQARVALGRALRAAVLHGSVVALVVGGHVVASTRAVALELETHMCAARRMSACDAAAELLPPRSPEILRLSRRACTNGIERSCVRLEDRLASTSDRGGAERALHEACDAHVGVACGAIACSISRATHAGRSEARRYFGRSRRYVKAGCAPLPGPIPPAPGDACPSGMALVRGGVFDSAWSGASVEILPLCADKTEVTASDFLSCPRSVCPPPSPGEHCTLTDVAGWDPRAPLNCVSHDAAAAYCAFRHARLPTLVEWEWMSRGGEEARLYPWGNEAPGEQRLCWSAMQHRAGPCTVGAFPAGDSADGLSDLVGNVAEWTSTILEDASDFAYAGGSWRSTQADRLRMSRPRKLMAWETPGTLGGGSTATSPDIGFRCVDIW